MGSSHNAIFGGGPVLAQADGTSAGTSDAVRVGVAVGIAIKVLGQTTAVTRTAAFQRNVPPEVLDEVNKALEGAQRTFAVAQSQAQQGQYSEVSTSLAEGISILGGAVNAIGGASTDATKALSQVILSAEGAKSEADAASSGSA
jgi:hypothetical protein